MKDIDLSPTYVVVERESTGKMIEVAKSKNKQEALNFMRVLVSKDPKHDFFVYEYTTATRLLHSSKNPASIPENGSIIRYLRFLNPSDGSIHSCSGITFAVDLVHGKNAKMNVRYALCSENFCKEIGRNLVAVRYNIVVIPYNYDAPILSQIVTYIKDNPKKLELKKIAKYIKKMESMGLLIKQSV